MILTEEAKQKIRRTRIQYGSLAKKVKPDFNTVIHFEDEGQDFLKWTIDPKGKLIGCEPFQFSIWSKYLVTNKRFKVGGFVHTIGTDWKPLTIKYPIEKVEKVPVALKALPNKK